MTEEPDIEAELDADWRVVDVAFNRRDLITYALGIGCRDLRHTYEDHEDFAAFPTYPVVLGFKGNAADVVSFPSPAMAAMTIPPLPGTRALLDGERFIERVKPIPAEGAALVLRSKLVGVEPKLKGALVHSEGELRTAEGELLYRMQSTGFAVGAKGVARVGRGVSEAVPVPTRAADATHDERVGEQQVHKCHSPHLARQPTRPHTTYAAGAAVSAVGRLQRAARRPGHRLHVRLRAADPSRAVHARLLGAN